MAKVFLVTTPGSRIKVFYNVDEAVGKGCPNRSDDVALVQFFLRAVMEDDKSYTVPAGGPLSIDGIFGPQTLTHIQSWQQQENKQADSQFQVAQDGQVSPVVVRSGIASRTHTRYALVAFNVIYAGVNGADKHANIASDSRCPTSLLPSIFW
jgi:peptidoglycan hydrolase-like protein with peptidoglycan-binding domain